MKYLKTYESFHINKYDNEYPIIKGNYIGDLFVREKIPNIGSIESSLNNYEILKGVREISFSKSFPEYELHYYSLSDKERTHMLMEQIKENKEINPLIVVIDNEGPYILEGSHRFDALKELGIDLFPAKIVLDLDLLTESTKTKKSIYYRSEPSFIEPVKENNYIFSVV